MFRRTQGTSNPSLFFTYGSITLCAATFQMLRLKINFNIETLQPQFRKQNWFGLIPFRSPLLRESLLLSFPPGTEMFHFPGYRFTYLFNSVCDNWV